MKTIKMTALAAAVAMGAVPTAVLAEVDVLKTNDVRVYLNTAIEIEKMIYREDPATDGETVDKFDNEVEFGVGAEFNKYWEAYFEMEVDNLSDTTNSKVGRGDEGSIEFTSAWVNYEKDNIGALAGVFRKDLAGGTRIWFREHMVGARFQYELSDLVGLEVGTGTLNEEGDDWSQDRQLTWATTTIGNAYGTLGLYQDGPETPGQPTGTNPQADDEFGDLYNLAVGWKGKLGDISAQAEFNQNFGDAESGESFKGYAAYAEFSTKLGAHKPRLLLAYGSGDNDPTDNDVGEFRAARADLTFTKMMIDEGFIENITTTGVGGVEDGQDSIGNITLLQVGNTVKVNDVWRADLSATYLALSQENDNGDKYLGTELNWLNRWDLPNTTNVRLYLDLGYLIAADAFGPDNVWIIEPGVRVVF
jgi:hypothetical protein